MVKNPLDFKLGVGLTLFCLILFFYLIPKHVGPISEPDTFMPMMATVFIQILAVILIIQACGSSKIDQSQSLEKKGNSVKLLAGVVVIMVIYAWLLDLTGFLLTSSVVMVSLFIIFGVRSFKKISLIMLIVLGLLYFSFEKLLYAPLPVGTLIEPFLG